MFFEINKEVYGKLPVVLHSIGVHTEQNEIIRPEGLPFHELIWVRRGAGSFKIDGEKFILEEGKGIFMRSGVGHEYSGEDFSTAWCTFSMPDEALDYMELPRILRFDVPGFLDAETDALYEFATGDSTVVSRSSAVYSFITDFCRAVLESRDNISVKVIRLLESRYSEPLTIEAIAKEIGIDYYTLCHTFMKQRGTTVMQELKRIRIAKAKRFLRYSSESVEHIGKLCGFESSSYFGKRFRELCGMSPLEYRKGQKR